MTPDILQKLQADAKARGIDISSLPWLSPEPNTQGMMPENIEIPQNQSIDLVSYIQSISDGIAQASDADVIAMINEITNIRTWWESRELPEQI